MDTLVQLCTESVVKHHARFHPDDLKILPLTLKDKALTMMCKRGLLTDANAEMFLHKEVVALNFSECNIGNGVVRGICQCSHLRFINLGSSEHSRDGITSTEIGSLATSCPHLNTVLLHNCINVTDEDITQLSQSCSRLEELDVSECQLLTDLSLYALAKYSANLACISFSGTCITDHGIRRLVNGINGSHLKEIVMKRCPQLTDNALESIIMHCSSLTILNFNGCPKITDRSRERVSRQQGALSKLKQISWTIY